MEHSFPYFVPHSFQYTTEPTTPKHSGQLSGFLTFQNDHTQPSVWEIFFLIFQWNIAWTSKSHFLSGNLVSGVFYRLQPFQHWLGWQRDHNCVFDEPVHYQEELWSKFKKFNSHWIHILSRTALCKNHVPQKEGTKYRESLESSWATQDISLCKAEASAFSLLLFFILNHVRFSVLAIAVQQSGASRPVLMRKMVEVDQTCDKQPPNLNFMLFICSVFGP